MWKIIDGPRDAPTGCQVSWTEGQNKSSDRYGNTWGPGRSPGVQIEILVRISTRTTEFTIRATFETIFNYLQEDFSNVD